MSDSPTTCGYNETVHTTQSKDNCHKDGDTQPMLLPAHVVDNSASLGAQLLIAKSSIPMSRNNNSNQADVIAIACRTYDCSKESNTQSILNNLSSRFVLHIHQLMWLCYSSMHQAYC